MPTYTSSEFKELLNDHPKLQQLLNENKQLLSERDANHQTLLHHAATVDYSRSDDQIRKILQILFSVDELDFSARDEEWNSPIDIAAISAMSGGVYSGYVFPEFVKQGIKANFDFSALNGKGYTILHLATICAPDHNSCVKILLDLFKNPKLLHVMSQDGLTPMQQAIQQFNIEDAAELLRQGATEKEISKAIEMVDENLKLLSTENTEENKIKNKLVIFKSELLSCLEKARHASIVKSTLFLVKAAQCGSLRRLDANLVFRIAADTRTIDMQQVDAEKIAVAAFHAK